MNFLYVKTRDDYIKLINNIKDTFKSVEDWEDFFGFHLKWDEETGEALETIFEYQGEIEFCPSSFPAIIYSLFDDGRDRFGQFGVRIFDFATLEDLGIKL